MPSVVRHVTIDCADAYNLALFWADVLGGSLAPDDNPGDPQALVSTPDGRVTLLLQRVPESKTVKNRVHLDLSPVDRTRDEEVDRLLVLGASLVADHRREGGAGFAVLRTPRATSSVSRATTTSVRQPRSKALGSPVR